MSGDDASPWATIAGGGTAGHVIPGLAIARALVRRDHPKSTIHYVGSTRGIERELVPDAGFPLVLLPGRGIQRRLTVQNVPAIVGLVRAAGRALALLARRRPKVVVALGGYASVPVAAAAAVWRVPVVVAEQNAVPGAANRFVARFAKAAAVSFPDTPLPRAVVTGNPIREEVLAVDRRRDRDEARAALELEPGRKVVLVFGGSLGALRINRATIDAVRQWKDRTDLAVRHVVGDRDWAIVQAERPALDEGGLQYQAVRYEHDMPRAHGRRRSGRVPVGLEHLLRARRGRPAGAARALAERDRRPPDGERPPPRGGRGRGRRRRRRAGRRRAWWPWSMRCSPTRTV